MSDEAAATLRAAADHLEDLAARTTGGRWVSTGLLATRPEVVARYADGTTEHVAEARAGSARWIVTLDPSTAAPLAAWLRATASGAGAGTTATVRAALDVAGAILAPPEPRSR